MSDQDWDVVIVGAGAGGLTLANYLGKSGVRVLILDPRPGIEPLGRGELIQPLGLEILEELSLLEGLYGLPHCRNEGFQFLNGKSELLMRSRYSCLEGRFPFAISLEPHHLDQLMLSHLTKFSGVTVIFGARYLSHRTNGPGVVVEWEESGVVRSTSASVLVGDDGRRSRVRSSGQFSGQVVTYKDSYLSWSFDIPPGEPDVLEGQEGRYFLSAGKIFFLFPVSPTRRFFLYMLKNRDRRFLNENGLEGLMSELNGWVGGMSGVLRKGGLQEATQIPEMVVMKVSLKNWVDGNVVLIGDAAHAMNPHVAQGRNQAMQDARVLANLLCDGLAQGSTGCSSALSEYERIRRPVTENLHRLADEMTLVWNSGNPIIVKVRERVFRGIGRKTPLQRKIVRTISGLGFEPLTVIDRMNAFLAGG
ncbi:MAG: FAD-dependent oxidoreductase [Leptospirales bacterium]